MRRDHKILAVALAIALLLALWAIAFAPTSDAADFDPDNPETFSVLPSHCDPNVPGKCSIQFYGNDRPIVVLWGDSHAVQQLPAIQGHTANAQHNLVAFTMGLCPPMRPPATMTDACSVNARAAIDYIANKVSNGKRVTVIMGGAWHYYFHNTDPTDPRFNRAQAFRDYERQAFEKMAQLGVRLMGINQTPTLPYVEDETCTLESTSCLRTTMLPDESTIHVWLINRVTLASSRAIADIKQYLCDTAVCNVNVGTVPLYFDAVHLNVNYTSRHNPAFRWAVL